MKVLVTGGAGFIGSAVCRHLVGTSGDMVVNADCLTYAGTLTSLRDIENHDQYRFEKADIRNGEAMLEIMRHHDIDAIMHLAAESHVDRSIDGPSEFIETNIIGTFRLLNAAANTSLLLTENFAMSPTAAVSGYYLAHPEARYFGVGRLGRDQVADYARRKGWTLTEAEKWLAPNLGYEPDSE